MVETQAQIRQIIEPLVRQTGCELFDIEAPTSRSGGVLRVYISKGGKGAVSIDECAAVSRLLDEVPQLDELIEGSYVLEVSSPGINRSLSRPEHFTGAVGERIKIVTEEAGGKGQVVRGTLLRFEDGVLEVQDEERRAAVQVNLSQVKRANVDFKF